MTKHRFLILCLAALTVLVLAACGDTTEVSSAPEGIETFGEINNDIDAEPSNAAATTTAPDSPETSSGTSSGVVVENNAQTSSTTTAVETTASAKPTTSTRPNSNGGSTTTTSPSTSPTATASPEISPPAPASTATADQVEDYVGKSLSSLIADLGYPSRSDYEPIDEDDPDAGDIGTLFFDGFTVTTERTADGETVTSVNRS